MLFGFDLDYFILWVKGSAIEKELAVFGAISNRLGKAIEKAKKEASANESKISALNAKNEANRTSILRASKIIDKITDLVRV